MSLNNGAELSIAEQSEYNYIPSRTVAIIMLVLFSLSTALHFGQALRYRLYWLLPTACLCGVAEILGWSGRLWSSFSPLLDIPFEIQISSTILAPTPLLAANFIIFGRIIHRLGHQYSRLNPRLYTIIFCACDTISLVVQGLGGGLASSADDEAGANRGGNIMLGGIAFQLVVIIFYVIISVEYFVRYTINSPISSRIEGIRKDNGVLELKDLIPGRFTFKLKAMTGALLFNTTVLFIRAIYRLIELSDGWNGRIISTERYFNILDGAMVILAIYTMNIIHPGIFLDEPEEKPVHEKTHSEV